MPSSPRTGPTSSIAFGVYALCVAVVIVFAASNLQVLSFAGGIADDVRAEVEHNLVQAEIRRQMEILARDQSQISQWDDTVRALGPTIDTDFVEAEIADWMWEDFGIESSVVLGADDRPELTVFKSSMLDPEAGAAYVAHSRDLVRTAQEKYLAQRTAKGAGFVVAGHRVRSLLPLYVADIRLVEGEFGVVVAQAIVPDDVAVLPDGLPKVLLTFKPLDGKAFAEIGRDLGLEDFRIEAADAPAAGRGSMIVSQVAGQPLLKASWKVDLPSDIIWSRSIGALAVSFVMVVLSLALVAYRYGRALKALQSSDAENRHRALHDSLTGLPNRLQFDQALDDVIDERRQDRCAILCLDLDRFKAVNDTFGHQAGDVVIRTAARRIADAVGPAGMAARVGGDEFMILLRDGLDHDSVLARCEGIIASLCEDIAVDGGIARIGASIGAAWWPDDALTAKAVIREADQALYRAKDNGRGHAWFAGGSGKDAPVAAERRKATGKSAPGRGPLAA
ncbi:diguanylate cyclase (GGDEF)-like protein [Hoeflea marina]|uniref:Diguanylate cyclase (GGDEF)-like protein n=1 Tax=Hoeflea marina TaxID=274592 RepID=A0A317PMN2_9HYPH|nr:diguanylate cyclase [Hoeflea marina]PWW02152.1 diguanylate cyclase (GGDEF)-like protein [Hoeflea marina]